ncbi:hypothetical protein ANME2D_03434 [Candidatus Methanoperedens nitroreducens]|uniref:Uncharacterized protein n=1 Tax=Candidatus Methanoperedens nitratireducens TaxID=1392998 RepID=A0A062V103_9EURY|nr:hypothetical protein [Candidatus Methanoperedens nitroreducens]KCZ70318.1 hypothetical protein ANME2D_03434 [Candidatus Methanoperedens nitroreducens]MDJ1421356.1 hypothetical protein [Candidatus Methanoperedens sp.]
MKYAPRYITSIPIQNQQTGYINISLGSDKNGAIGIYFGDSVELEQSSNYMNDDAFPNSGLLASGKYSMWLSMFSRHIKMAFEDDD